MNARIIYESGKWLAKALQLSREGFLFYRLSDLTIVEINEAFAQVFDFRREDLIGKKLSDLDIGGTDISAREFADLLIKHKTLRDIERSFRTRSGQKGISRISADLVEVDGKLYGFAIGRDITEEKKAEAEKARLLTILESATDFIGIADREGKIVYCNRALREFMGASDGKPLQNVYIPDYHPQWMQELVKNEALGTVVRDGVWKGEIEAVNPQNGEKVAFSQILIAHKNDAGKIEFISAIGRDISEIKKREAQFRAIFENASDGILIADDEGRYLDANPAICALLKIERGQIINQTIADLVGFASGGDFPARWREFLTKGEESGIVPLKNSGGESIIAEYAAKANFLPGRHLSVIRDISQRFRAEEALHKSEERFRALIENSYDIISIHDAGGRLIYQSPSVRSVLGYEPGELIGDFFGDYLHPKDKSEVKQTIKRLCASPEVPLTLEARFRHKDGSWRSFEGRGVNLLENPAVGGIVFNFRDISERRKAQSSLRKSEMRFRNVVESLNEGLLITDFDDIVLYVNSRLTEMLGYSLEEMLGQPAYKFLLPPERWEEQLKKNRQRKSGESEKYEHEFLCKDGSRLWCETNAVPFCNNRNEIVGTIGVITDITERRQFQQKLAERTEQLARAQEIARIGGWEWNIKTNEVKWSDEKYRLFGLEPQSLTLDAETFLRFVYPEDRAFMREFAAGINSVRELAAREYRIIRQDNGEIRTLRSVIKTVLDEKSGKPLKISGTDQDITEMKMLEEQLRQAQKLESVGLLAGGIAHDFNNMLTAINGYSELLLAKLPAEEPLRLMVEEVKKAGQRSATLTAQLLAYSRKQILQPKTININAIISDIDKMLQRVIGEDIDLETVLEPALWNTKADPSQIVQIVLNLAVNARDAMPNGGRLLIKTQNMHFDDFSGRRFNLKPGNYVMLAVSDNGCGIDGEMQNRIFEPFFTTKETGKGTGMGLATVYGIVQQSGGGIWVDSEVRRGSIFNIYLPKAGDEASPARSDSEPERNDCHSETILLVEDEDVVRSVVKQILEEYGYRVLEASGGGDAILLFEREKHEIGLLLTDVIMPNMSGRELSNYLLKINPALKVLYMSGYTTGEIVHHGVLDEDTEFIQKPFTSADLAEKVKEILNKKCETNIN